MKVEWLEAPEEHDYPAARSYLNLIFDDKDLDKFIIPALIKAPVVTFKAKDIFRASGLNLLGVSNSHVEHNLKKIKEGKQLSPILLVRDYHIRKVHVADGYHRLCACYQLSEDLDIPCKIVNAPKY